MSSTLLLLIVLLLGGLLAYSGNALMQMQRERDRLRQELRRYDSLTSREETERQLDSNISLKRSDLAELERQRGFLNNQINNLQQELRELEAKAYLQSIDYYEQQYDFISSGDYIIRMEDIKLQQERMRKDNRAFICDTQWKIGEGKKGEKEGKKMTNELLKLVEFSFETQCKYAKKEVKYNNIDNLKQKINKSFDKINRYLKKINCRISKDYLQLKLIELDLKYELEEKKQDEKEREQELKKQNREREAIEKARQKAEEAEEREKLHQQELDRVWQEIEQVAQAEVEKRKQLELQIQQLEQQIAEDRSDQEKANRVKWGYIYIISNIGSLGRDVYRICRTIRNKPDEYIRDMNPVVPFRFDVHFKIFSEDAFDTLERLHQRFDNKRVNLVNQNRDFFKVSMNELEQAVQAIARETGVLRIDEFERAPQASEYRQTLDVRKKNQHLTSDNSHLGEDEIA